MKKLHFLIVILLSFSLALQPVSVFANNYREIVYISFDNDITNDLPSMVNVSGSENNRVIEYGERNKVLSLATGYEKNNVSVPIPDVSGLDKYIIEFEAGHMISPTSGAFSIVNKKGSETVLFTMSSDGSLYNDKNKSCGAVGLNNLSKISVKFDCKLNTYSVFINKRCVLENWDTNIKDAAELAIRTSAVNKSESYMLIDNIRVYEGDMPAVHNSKSVYNPQKTDFEPVDETNSTLRVIANNNMNESGAVQGVTMIQKSNKITHEFEGDNGFITLEKLDNEDSLYVNMLSTGAGSQTIFEYDIRTDGSDWTGLMAYMVSGSSGSEVRASLASYSNGAIVSNKKSQKMSYNKWNTVGIKIDSENHTYGVYLNGKAVEGAGTLPSNFAEPAYIRVQIDATSEIGKTNIDNLRIYDGTDFRDVSDIVVEEKSIYTDNDALSVLKGKTALSPYSNKIYTNNKKQDTDTKCIINGDEALVSADTFKKLFNAEPVINGNVISVGGAIFTVGEYQMSCNGKKITISAAPQIIDGQVMLPVDAYGKNVLGEKYYNDNAGMMLVSNKEINTSDTSITGKMREASRFMLFDRYSESELLGKLKAKNGEDLKTHPRLLATADDFEKLKEEISSDKFKKKWYEILIAKADELAKQNEVPVYDVSSGRLFGVSEALRENSIILGMAYRLTGDSRYADSLIDRVLAVCAFPDWYPDHYLGTSDIERSVAICFDWCYDVLTEEEKAAIYSAAKEFGLKTANQIYCGSASFSNNFWGKTDTNWGGWVNSGVIELCLATAEMDPEYTTKVLERALRSMEYPISAIAPDGAWHEGASYWAEFFNPTALGMASYESALGEVYKGVYQKGMEGMCSFKEYVTTPTGKTGSYNDGGAEYTEAFARLYIAKKNGWSNIMRAYTDEQEEFEGDKVSPYDAAISLLWYDTGVTSENIENEYPLDGYFRETELVSMRQAFGEKNSLWFMADGGISNTSHSHLDTGSFQMYLDGIQWAKDLGRENAYYSRDGKNYAVNAGYTNNHYYRRKMEGHNTVVINPDKELEIDKNVRSYMQKPVSGIGRAYTSIDLTDAYTSEKVKKYKRGYLLSEGRRAFTVRDEIELAKQNSDLYWFMHTDGVISIADENTALITLKGKTLKMQFVVEGDNVTYELTKMEQKRLIDLGFQESENKGEKVTLKLKASGKVNITVKMSMLNEPQSSTPVETAPIDNWTVNGDDTIAPTGGFECSAKISAVKIDGADIGAAPDNFELTYTVEGSVSGRNIEVISNYKTDLSEIDTYDGNKKYMIRAFDDNGFCNTYFLTIKQSPFYIEGYDLYNVVGADVSSEQTTQTTSQNNLRTGSYDRDETTRWSALGKNEWIVHDLGEEKSIDAFAIMFYNGATRTYGFDIQVSNDGVNFTDVLVNKTSSGKTDNAELFIPGSTVKARYVKYIGHGSSANEWNNIVELMTLKKK